MMMIRFQCITYFQCWHKQKKFFLVKFFVFRQKKYPGNTPYPNDTQSPNHSTLGSLPHQRDGHKC